MLNPANTESIKINGIGLDRHLIHRVWTEFAVTIEQKLQKYDSRVLCEVAGNASNAAARAGICFGVSIKYGVDSVALTTRSAQLRQNARAGHIRRQNPCMTLAGSQRVQVDMKSVILPGGEIFKTQ